MWPNLIIAENTFPVYNLVLAVGVLLSLLVFIIASRRKRMAVAFLADHFFLLFGVTFLSARLVEVLLRGYSFIDSLFFWQDLSFNFYGGLIGFLLALYFICQRKGENFFAWLDLTALATGCVLIFHHLGTFLAGRACGVHTSLFWGITFTDPAVDAACLASPPVHPLQLYAMLLTVLFFGAAVFVFRRTRITGKAGLFLILMLSLSSFLLDFLRADSAPAFGGLRASQYFAIGLSLLAVWLLLRLKHATHHTHNSELHLHPPTI